MTQLQYAPPVRSQRLPFVALGCGLLTTALTLVALHFVQENTDTDIMSFTVKFIIPVGAIIVGVCAGLGYWIASLAMHLRLQKYLLWLIVLLQILAYFGALFIEFKAQGPLFDRQTGKQVNFAEYYHVTTVNMVWVSDSKSSSTPAGRSQSEPDTLGLAGYFFRGLGVLGFVLGGMIGPLIVGAKPYCDLCQRYKKNLDLMLLPAAAQLTRLRIKGAVDLQQPEHRAMLDRAVEQIMEVVNAIMQGDFITARTLIKSKRPKISSQVPVVAHLKLVYCRQCRQGTLSAMIKPHANFQGTTTVLVQEELSPETVREIAEPTYRRAAPAPSN